MLAKETLAVGAKPGLLLFSATASVIFLVLLPYNLWRLYHSSVKVRPSWHGTLKIGLCVLYAALHLRLLIWTLSGSVSILGTVASSLNFAASFGLIWLSIWAHKRSIQPSALIQVYLLAKTACHIVWIPEAVAARPGLYAYAFPITTLALLLLESQNKRRVLLKAYADEPPEAVTSFLGNILFLWINPILARGYGNELSQDDIPGLDQSLASKTLRQAVIRTWDQRAKPDNRASLPRVLLTCLLAPFLSAIVPRILVVVFRFAQPLLISRAIRFVTDPSVEKDGRDAFWIIVAAAAIYIGMALSTSVYQHRLNRLQVMIRGALIGLLHDRALNARGSDEDNGRVVTLLSNDISNVQTSGDMFHGTWGQFSEVVVGTLLLAREVGWLWPVPIVFIFFCSRVSRYVAIHLKAEQGRWNKATQQRISATSSMLGAMKNIKMLGMQETVANHVEDLRRQEMDAAKGVRWLMVAYNASANALGMFAPVLTIVLYAILAGLHGEPLDVETAFTTIAILAMITHPANMVMTFVPRAVVSFASFERIQAYLVGEHSVIGPVLVKNSRSSDDAEPAASVAVGFQNATIAALTTSEPVLRDVTFEVPQGSIAVLTGPVGSGKTTLARALLGEMQILSGSVSTTSTHIAYCAQTAWLPDRAIKDIILGPDSHHDDAWYQTTIHACSLTADLAILPEGDQTRVGSNGMNLSGGQQQRVALARAVYSRCSILVLDDSFSALDGSTQRQVIADLLGRPTGLLRELGATVVWISTATQHFHLADEVVVLADGRVQERGSWELLREGGPQLEELIHSHDSSTSTVARTFEREDPKPIVTRDTAASPSVKQDTPTSRRNGDFSLYRYYMDAARPCNIALLLIANAICAFFKEVPPYWLKLWTESAEPAGGSLPFYTVIYLLILFAAWLGTNGIMSTTHLLVAPTSGLALHTRLVHATTAAPLAFLSATPTSTLLNRFGADLQLVDTALAPALAALATQVFKLLTQTTLLLLAQPRVALALPPSAAVVYVVQRVYLRTSRPLRTAELSSRAAVLGAFTETVAGAPTLRAFGWQASIAGQASDALDASQRPLYLLLCLQRWLNVVLDLLVAAVAVGTISLAVYFRGSTTGGAVGMALNVILVVNTTLLSFVQSWTGLEISLGAVARLREAENTTQTEEEEEEEEEELPLAYQESCGDRWPKSGKIVFSTVVASYKPSAQPVLGDVSLTIEPGQTVVVCGRTGSGKSSLLLSLLRLLDTTAGTITVDGVDITAASRKTIRERVFITVAQEAFFLPQGTLRFNLDPEGRAEPRAVVGALVKTGLWELFRDRGTSAEEEMAVELAQLRSPRREDQVILDTPLSSLPNLSTGQCQLLALARALVRRHILCSPSPSTYSDHLPVKPVILLDEVTSSLDPVTEGQIYDVMEEEFVKNGHTIVMVTHKLSGIKGRLRKGRDMVLWMSEGRVDKVETVGQDDLA
ncbi:unnamed protein product [Discula destructiva]